MVLINQFVNFKIGGVTVTTTSTELNYNSGVIAGTAKASGTLVLDANKDIAGINSLSANLLTGELQTGDQPNITSLGTIENLLSTGSNIHGVSGTGLLKTTIIDDNIYLQPSLDNTTGSATHLFITNYDEDTSTSARVFGIMSNGRMGVQSINPSKQVEINSSSGNNLRLTYNNMNGTATNYTDLLTTSTGNLTITTSGTTTTISKQLVVNDAISNFAEGGLTVKSYNNTDNYGRLIKQEIITTLNLTNYNPAGVTTEYNLNIYGYIKPLYSQTYTFYITWNNGCRLFINNVILFNKWSNSNNGTGEVSQTISLIGNTWYPIYIESYNYSGTHSLRVEWESTSQLRQDIPATNMAWSNETPNINNRMSIANILTLFSNTNTISTAIAKSEIQVNSSGSLLISPSSGTTEYTSSSLFSRLNLIGNEYSFLRLKSLGGANDLQQLLTFDSHSNSRGGGILWENDTNSTKYFLGRSYNGGSAISKLSYNVGTTINDSTNTKFVIQDDGNVGIGYDSPNVKLYIRNTSSNSTNSLLVLDSNDNTDNSGVSIDFKNSTSVTTGRINNYRYGSSDYGLVFSNFNGGLLDHMVLRNSSVGIGTSNPDKRLEVNSPDGECLRLTYNDNNGSAVNYTDFAVNSSGNLVIFSSGYNTIIDNNLIVDTTNIEAFLVRKNIDSGDVFVVDTTNELVNIVSHDNSSSGLQLNGVLVTSSAVELNYLDLTTGAGIAEVSKALILDGSGNIVGINSLSSTSLTGTLQTASQPNITNLGTLTELNSTGISKFGDLTGPSPLMRISSSGTLMYIQTGLSDTINSSADLFFGNILTSDSTSNRKFIYKADGKIGIGTIAPDKQLEINSSNGNCLRLTYNDSDGSATNYVDFLVSSSGDLTITPSGNDLNISSHNGSTSGLKLGGVLVTASATEINILDGLTATTAELNKLDGLTSTTAELNNLDLTFGTGTAEASKALVLDISKNIAGINSLSATSLTGTLQTTSQPNITSLGELTELNSTGVIKFGDLSGPNPLMRIYSSGSVMYIQTGTSNTINSSADLFFGNILNTDSTSSRKFMIKAGGSVGIGTNAPDKQLEINSTTGNCLRLTNNDSNGSATNYADFSVSSGGDLTINPSGNDINLQQARLKVIIDSSFAFDVTDGTTTTMRVNTSSERVGINSTSPDKALEVNSATGDCLRLTYNDSNGSATSYTDFSVTSGGNLEINSTGNNIYSQSSIFVDNNSIQALVIRKNGNSGDVFVVDTVNSTVGINNSTPSYDLDINGSINYTDNLYNNNVKLQPATSYDIDLTTGSYSLNNYYPIIIEKYNGNYGHSPYIYFQICGEHLPSSNIYNENTLHGWVRNGGDTDHIEDYDITLSKFNNSENRLYGIYVGTNTFRYGICIYIRGGYRYNIYSDGGSVFVGTDTASLTRNDAVFAIKNSSGTDIVGSTTNAIKILDLGGNSGKYINNIMNLNNDLIVNNNLIVDTSLDSVGINTTSPNKALEVNSTTGDCVRLTYNNSVSNYVDLIVSNSGIFNILPNSEISFHKGSFIIDNTSIDSLLVRKNNDTKDIFVVDTDNEVVGVNTSFPDKALEVNSSTGECLRLTYNDPDGSATNYVDFLVSSSGDLTITPSGNDLDISSHNGSTVGLKLGGVLVTATATELNKLDGLTATTAELNNLDLTFGTGTAEASKALVLDSSKNITGINNLTNTGNLNISGHDGSTTGLQLNGTLVTATATELNKLDGLTATTAELNYLDLTTGTGTAEASKALVLDSNKNIIGIGILSANSLGATSLSGTLYTASQPNITSLGELTELNSTGVIKFGDLSGPNPLMRISSSGGVMYIQTGTSDTSSSSADLFFGNILNTDSTSSRKFMIKAGGNVGIGTNAPDKQLEINSTTGNCLRLTYNDSDGSATNYADFSVSSGGDLTINSSGNDINLQQARLKVIIDSSFAFDVTDGTTTTMRVNTSSERVGINSTDPDKALEINSATGDCLRLTYNDSNGSATNYTDITTTSGGNLVISSTGGNIYSQNNIVIDNDWTQALAVRKNGAGGDVFVVDTVNGRVGIGGTPTELLHLKSTGPAFIKLEADTDNVTETDNVGILMSQDGGAITSYIKHESSAGVSATNSLANALLLNSTDTVSTQSYIQLVTDDIVRMTIDNNGSVGVNTNNPDKALEVNSSTGDCLRLTYNDSNGSATSYTDLTTGSGGSLTITPSGNKTVLNSTLGINTTNPSKRLEVNSSTGDCMRLTYNDNDGSAVNYTDFSVNSVGNMIIEPSKGKVGIHIDNTGTYNSSKEPMLQIMQNDDYNDIGNTAMGSFTAMRMGTNKNNKNNNTATSYLIDYDYNQDRFTSGKLIFKSMLGTSTSATGLTFETSKSTTDWNFNSILTLWNQKIGINTTSPDKALEINSATGDCMRLTYNDSDGSATNYVDFSVSSGGDLTMNASGNDINISNIVNINNASPYSVLNIKQLADFSAVGSGLSIERQSNTNRWTLGMDSGDELVFYYNGTSLGYLLNNNNVFGIDFTGQHRNITDNVNIMNNINMYVGMIVYATGEYINLNNEDLHINEALPKVELTNSYKDKRVFGVISNREEENREYTVGTFASVYKKIEGDDRLIINSLGEGMIWVCNKNGKIENGDYIVSCEAVGYGTKQDNEFLCNYTVAKITQDCDFSSPERYIDLLGNEITEIEYNSNPSNGYKCNFVGCTYHCG